MKEAQAQESRGRAQLDPGAVRDSANRGRASAQSVQRVNRVQGCAGIIYIFPHRTKYGESVHHVS